VRDTLKAFPSEIEDVYRRTLHRISKAGRKHASLAKTVLLWVVYASRSLTIDELIWAVATSPDTHKFEPAQCAPGPTLISNCGGLVTFDEESRLVRLVRKSHNDNPYAILTRQSTDYTAKETLQDLLREEFPRPHSLLSAVCMTHLAASGFQDTTISSEEEFQSILEKDPLLKYASEAWAFHTRAALSAEGEGRRAAQFLNECKAFPAFTSIHGSKHFDILTPLHILARYDLPFALLKGTSNSNAMTEVFQQSAFMLASRFGHEEAAAFLLAHPDIQVNLTNSYGWSALMQAAVHGREGIVKILLAHSEIEVNLTNGDGESALMLAAWPGHEGTVKLLLTHPEIQANLVDKEEWSALMFAAHKGHAGTVKLLLAYPGIQVNLANITGWSALMHAAENAMKALSSSSLRVRTSRST
jgi:ankyrin repeat domain-containing protein 50